MKPDRRQKFVELAEKRVNRALTQIKLIGNLSNQDVAKIYKALKKSLDEMRARFDSKGGEAENQFKL